MKYLASISRKQLIDIYLDIEAVRKNKVIPPSYSSLDFNDPNMLDRWLDGGGYKKGVISGFNSWALVELSESDLAHVAVVNHIFKSGRVLKHLVGKAEFNTWMPNQTPLPIWYEPHSAGRWDDSFSIILRASTDGEKAEGARLYAEDGSGRSICYFRYLTGNRVQSRMRGYIGFDLDLTSTFLQKEFDGQFVRRNSYATFDKLVRAISI